MKEHEVFKDDAIEELGCYGSVTATLSDGSIAEIATGDYFLGGTDEGYICDMLGNVQYPTARAVVNAFYNYIESENLTVKEIR